MRLFVTLQAALCKGLHFDIVHRGQSQVCLRICHDSYFFWGPAEKKTPQALDLSVVYFPHCAGSCILAGVLEAKN